MKYKFPTENEIKNLSRFVLRKKNKNIRGLKKAARNWITVAWENKLDYEVNWLGIPIIQNPYDMVRMQELIFRVKPDVVIETGIAHGGSLIFSAAILELNAVCGGGEGEVLGIDIDIRSHNYKAIEEHPLSKRISMIEGSSIAPEVIVQVYEKACGKKCILVFLDSNHTHKHVLAELQAFAQLISVGSYCVVFDTLIEDMPADMFPDRPWGKGNNPKTAVWEWLKTHPEFEIEKSIEHKLLITVAPDGYLKRVK
jgi:cephalosporin hydroxylase